MAHRNPGSLTDPPPARGGDRGGRLAVLSDEDCVGRARRGERDALEEVVTRHLAGVYNLFVRVFGDRELAADFSQEVFLRMHDKLETYDDQRSFRSWLYTIAWNYARDQIRRRRRQRALGVRSLDAPRADDPDSSFEPDDPGSEPPELGLETRERDACVRRALDGLPLSHRLILVLREYEGLSYEELARLLDCAVGTIKSRLNRARLELRDALLRIYPEGFDDA